MSWNEMWANAALCQQSAPDELFVRGAEQHKAKAVCGACPVRAECLAEALDNEIEWGVWGGLTERERRALLRKRPNVTSWRQLLETAKSEHEAAVTVETAEIACQPSALTLARASRGSPAWACPWAASSSPMRRKPVEVVHVGRQRRQHGGGYVGMAGREPTGQPLLALDDAQPVGVQPEQPGRQAVVLAASELAAARRRPSPRCADSSPGRLAAGAVDDQAGQRHPLLAQPLDEVRRLAQRVRLGRRDDQERRTPVLEQLEGALRPLPEAAEERVERGDERLHVL